MTYSARCLLGLWALAGMVMTCPAAAQQQPTAAIMLALGGHREIPQADRDAAEQAALEFLRTEDFVVVERTVVESSLSSELRACAPGQPCASDVRHRLGVDLLIGLVVWGTAESPDRPSSVHASILDATGTRYVGSATVQQGVPTAIRDALRGALRDQRRGPGPFLHVDGTRGAVVELDGSAIGTIPLTVRSEPGEHEMRVRLAGHEPQTLSVTVTDDPARTTELTVELRPERGHGTPGTPSGAAGTASWALPVGIAAIVAGLGVAIVPPVVSEAAAGCTQEVGGACVRANEMDVGAAVAWGIAGGVLAVTGVVLVIVAATEEGGSVQARFSPTGLALEGSF